MSDYLSSGRDEGASERREQTTQEIGRELDALFDRHAGYTTVGEDGTELVSVSVRFSSGSVVPAHVTSTTGEDGKRIAYMWLEPGKALSPQMYKYTDGKDIEPKLEPYKFDKDTGEVVPRLAGKVYDPNEDREVVFWGGLWVRNLRESPPIDPNQPPRRKLLHRLLGKAGTK
jgi:hypothetical protein